jgi:hypothetical protein
MPRVNEAPEGFKPDVTITIQVPHNSELKDEKSLGAFCTIEGKISEKQWCNTFTGFGDMVANQFADGFEDYLRERNLNLSDTDKRKLFHVYLQMQLVHLTAHLEDSFEKVETNHLEQMGKPKDVQA